MIVYTAMMGGIDRLQPPWGPTEKPDPPWDGVDFVRFHDVEMAVGATFHQGWENIWQNRIGHARTDAKRLKILPPSYIWDNHDASIWVDHNIFFKKNPIELFNDSLMRVFRHPYRTCITEEANVVKANNMDTSEKIDPQVGRYIDEEFPLHHALYAGCILVRKHIPEVRRFCDLWWKEIENGSHRDQISLPYVIWKTGFPIDVIEKNPFNCEFSLRVDHL